ncbi:hypothetical protein [Candidatus Paracaedibacter symbiosus]|uniref:hypothetical protein n=1 Tax=Candidatus Paracaedibacter symbiosus TaxID=244582 RepID=UPI001E3C916F|nr:hypothetical protein [Candidatus Paracaedibacter symbiosus]
MKKHHEAKKTEATAPAAAPAQKMAAPTPAPQVSEKVADANSVLRIDPANQAKD